MKKRYWLYDPIECKYSFFDDKDDRDADVESIIEECKNEDDGLWSDDMIDSIEIGVSEITHKVVQINVKTRPDNLDEDGYDEDGFYWSSDYDYICDYEMQKIKED